MNSTPSKPDPRPARRRTRGLWVVLCSLVLLAGCSTQTKHKWLAVFFDGVPPLGGATNGPATPVSAGNGSATNQTTQIPKPTAPAPAPGTIHQPFQSRQCDSCHEAGGGTLKLKKPALCWTCHKDFLAGEKVKHQPVENGECNSCHDPHRSPNKKLLLKTVPALCLTCHDDPLAAGKVKHQAVESGACSDCHAAHASNFKGLLNKSVNDT